MNSKTLLKIFIGILIFIISYTIFLFIFIGLKKQEYLKNENFIKEVKVDNYMVSIEDYVYDYKFHRNVIIKKDDKFVSVKDCSETILLIPIESQLCMQNRIKL